MNVIGIYQNNKTSLAKIIATLKAENVNFFDYAKATNSLNQCAARVFLNRLYNECLFLNSIYLDCFNNSNDINQLTQSYGTQSNEEMERIISLGKEIHLTIHNTED